MSKSVVVWEFEPPRNNELHVWVNDWRNWRRVLVQGNTLYLEIALAACKHCATCSLRIRTVEYRLRNTDVPWRLVHIGGSLYLAVEPEQMPARVDVYLRDLLGLPISQS